VYQNQENGYAVFDLFVDEDVQDEAAGKYVTAVGNLPGLGEGESVSLIGRWDSHPTYGRQFKVEFYEKRLPQSKEAILKYLSSRAVKGIGPVTAKKIVDAFGTDAFDILERSPELLVTVCGLSEAKAQKIAEGFREQFGLRGVMVAFGELFGPATCVKIYRKWGGGSVDIVRADPYLLCENIAGIGFLRADQLARGFGVSETGTSRIAAGIKHTLTHNASNNGHTFLPRKALIKTAAELMELGQDCVEEVLDTLVADEELASVVHHGVTCIYLARYYKAEEYIKSKLDLLRKTAVSIGTDDISTIVEQAEHENGIAYAPLQKKAIISAVSSGVMVLSGGPGTGKTTVIRAVVQIFERMGNTVALCAPTGRAAKRMSESVSREAKTIHRLLEMEFIEGEDPRFRRNADNLLEEEVIIVDESSMVDTLLLHSLLKAVRPGGRIIFIGDADQLPSVGAGNVLADLIECGIFETVILREIFRQAEESQIVVNAHAINGGELPNLRRTDGDFFFMSVPNEHEIGARVADLCARRLPAKYGESIREGIQVITPSRKGAAGVEPLNALLQSVLNPPAGGKGEKKSLGVTFRVGDRVMQVKNNYNIVWQKGSTEGSGMFNGDIGTVIDISLREETLTVDFEERIATYDFTMLNELDHAYAITIHKSQGSEYPVVIIPLFMYTPKLLTRELFYTAVTRARQMVILVGREDLVQLMVENTKRPKRYTGLRWMGQGE